MIDVHLLLVEDSFGSSVAITQDVLRVANLVQSVAGQPPLFQTHTYSDTGKPLRVSTGSTWTVDHAFPDRVDGVIVPFAVGMADVALLRDFLGQPVCARLVACLRRNAHNLVVASCSSTFLLAEAGLIRSRATTSWWLVEELATRYPDLSVTLDQMVVVDGRAVTAGAAMAQLDLMLFLVEKFGGMELARRVAHLLVLDGVRSSQAPYAMLNHIDRFDPLVARGERWMRDHLHERIPLGELARHLGISTRTLHRRFVAATGVTPAVFLRRLRMELADHLLRTTDHSVARVAEAVAYSDIQAFRVAFRSHAGVAPSERRS